MAERTPVEHLLDATEVGDNPLVGRPLPERPRLGRVELDRYLPALGGPLPYMQRLRRIDDQAAQHEAALADAWHALARDCERDPARFRSGWVDLASRWDFDDVNDLIARHNAYYPAEARLPMDPRSGDFVPVLGRSYLRALLDESWILERFPPELELAGAAASRLSERHRSAAGTRGAPPASVGAQAHPGARS